MSEILIHRQQGESFSGEGIALPFYSEFGVEGGRFTVFHQERVEHVSSKRFQDNKLDIYKKSMLVTRAGHTAMVSSYEGEYEDSVAGSKKFNGKKTGQLILAEGEEGEVAIGNNRFLVKHSSSK